VLVEVPAAMISAKAMGAANVLRVLSISFKPRGRGVVAVFSFDTLGTEIRAYSSSLG
jgi:hypothetical protein